MDLNTEPVKYAIIALTSPFWLPFVKALWVELNACLREEGGILGRRAPTAGEFARLEEKHGRFASSLVSEPREPAPRRLAPRRRTMAAGDRPSGFARPSGEPGPRRGFGPGGR